MDMQISLFRYSAIPFICKRTIEFDLKELKSGTVVSIMNRTLYYVLITITFGFISIPTVLGIIFQEAILTIYINSFIKTILIFFISIIEATFIKRTFHRMIGLIIPFVLFVGIQFKIMHWPMGDIIIIVAGVVLLINLMAMALIEKNKGPMHVLLFLFILQRLLIILTPPNQFLWWIDVVIAFGIALLGIRYILNQLRVKDGNG